jgi:twinkle protein
MELSARHMQLLEERGIEIETAAKLGWNSSGENLTIPYFQAGKQVGVKYRTLEGDKKFFQEKGSSQIFYNWDALRDTGTEALLITEGEMDCAIALQCGFLAVSVPNGAPMTQVESGDTKYAYLADLPDDRDIILAVDGDNVGANLLHDLSLRIGQHRCKWLKYPEGCKDLNDVFLLGGAQLVVEVVNKARWTKIDGMYRMSELPDQPEMEAFDCPVEGVSSLYKLRQGDLAVITGIPGHGKTTLMNHIIAGMALRHKWDVAVASFEQNPKIDHRRALRSFYHSKMVMHMSIDEKRAADDWIENRFTFLRPSLDDEANLKWVLDKTTAAILRHGCKMVVIDPWNEMDHDRPPGMSLTEYSGFAIKQFKRLAAKYLVHVVIVAHPAKMHRLKDGTYPIPSLYDISDSAHFINKPDIGLVVHRHDDGCMQVSVQKCRYIGTIGNIGDRKLRFERDKNQLKEVI